MDVSTLIHAASASATYFYVVGGVLVALALVLAFVGMRNEESFPSTNAMRGIIGVFALVVVATAVGAVWSARDEQAERRIHNEEAAHEAEEATEEAEEAEGDETEAEAAPEQDGDGGGEADLDGAQIFTDTGCGSCHTLADAGAGGQIGPDLDEVLPGQPAAMIRTSIVDPGAEVSEGFPAGTMPANYSEQLSDAELEALVSYLRSAAGG